MILQSGANGGIITDYQFNNYELLGFGDVFMVDINNLGQVAGNLIDGNGQQKIFFYNGANFLTFNQYYTSGALAINDWGQIAGEGLVSQQQARYSPFIIDPDGSAYELEFVVNPDSPEEGAGFIRDINNSSEVAAYSLNYPNDEHAFFLSSSGVVNIGSSLLNSNHSRALGLNDLGDVVGVNEETDRAFVYHRDDNSITQLGTLPGTNFSEAYAINNIGQVVGRSGSRAFIYNNGVMEDMGVSFPTQYLESRLGIDINDRGQAIVTSAQGDPFIYEDGILTNLNDLVAPRYLDLGINIIDARSINDVGQIVGQGTFQGNNQGFLLNPTYIATYEEDYINLGNISTVGDSVILEGGEINLRGEVVRTNGGSILLDGETIVENNLRFNSSVTENKVITGGGNITFSNTVDSAGTGDLRLQAGTGNILFSEAVGGEATFVDLAVEGADTVTINNDLAIDGNLSLEVINDITTANLSAAGLVNISLGKVGEEIYPSTGNVTIGNIDALGLEVLNNGNFTAGNLTTTDGDINVISLNQLNVGQLSATNGAIDLISGTAGINVSDAIEGDKGFIALAQQDIFTNEITSSLDAVILKSSQGTVTVNGSVTAFDDASLAAANNLTVGAVTSQDSSVALISAAGTIALDGTIPSVEDVTLASARSLIINQEIKAELGSIALGSTEGSVTTSVAIDSAIGINIAAKQNVSTKRIRTYGGDVVIDAQQGTTTIGGVINSRGGDIRVSGFNTVRTKNIISKSGDVSIISDTSLVRTGYIRTDRGNRNGDVYLEAGRNIRVGRAVEIDGEQYSIYAGDDGVINVAYQQNKKDNKRGQFVIGSPTGNGTLAFITSPVTTPIPTTPLGGGVQPNPVLIYIEVFRRVLDAG